MAEPWTYQPERDETELARIPWNPKLHPRIPGGKDGGGRFLSIADPVKRRAAMAQSKLAPVRQAAARGVGKAADRVRPGARKKDAPLAGLRERWSAPKLKAGQKYVRVAEDRDVADLSPAKIMIAAMRKKNPLEKKRKLAVAEGASARTKMGTKHTDRDTIEDVAPATIPGERARTKLAGGVMAQRVDKVKVGNNSYVVHKIGDVKSTDAEVLSSRVSEVLGTKEEFPRATRLGRNQHTVPFVKGKVLLERFRELDYQGKEPAMLATPESRRIGALDFLTGNPDRNLGNVLIQDIGNRMVPAAIDMGEAFALPHTMEAGVFDPDEVQHIPSNVNGQLFSVQMFMAMDRGEKLKFNPHDWTKELEDLGPEFEDLGREDWHASLMARHKVLTDYYDKSYGEKPKEGLTFQPASVKQPDAKDLPKYRALEELGKVHEDDDGVWQPGPHPGGQRALAERDARRRAGAAAPQAAQTRKATEDLTDQQKYAREREKFATEAQQFVDGKAEVRNATKLAGGQVNQGVHKIELANGRNLVDKRTDVPNEPEREVFISQHLAPAVGVNVPHSIAPEKGRIVMEYADGTLGEEVGKDTTKLAAFRYQARRIGALDAITGNPDRHEGNWIWKDGKLIAIDNAMGFQANRFNAKKIIQMGGGAGVWAKDAFRNLSVEEWREIRSGVKQMEIPTGDSRADGYKSFVMSNLNAIIDAKEKGIDWTARDLVRTLPTRYNWGMQTVVDLARDWNPDLHPRLFNGRFMKLSDSSRGWGEDPHLDPRVKDWNPKHSREERARGMEFDAPMARSPRSAEPGSDDAHWEAIGEYNDRFWRAAGVTINDDGTSSEPFNHTGREVIGLRQAVADAAPDFQRDRVRGIVHDPEFMDADLVAELEETDNREEAAQAILNRAYDMWDREYGDRERFASGFDPSTSADADWIPDADDDDIDAAMEFAEDYYDYGRLQPEQAERLRRAAEAARLQGRIEEAMRLERRIDAHEEAVERMGPPA